MNTTETVWTEKIRALVAEVAARGAISRIELYTLGFLGTEIDSAVDGGELEANEVFGAIYYTLPGEKAEA